MWYETTEEEGEDEEMEEGGEELRYTLSSIREYIAPGRRIQHGRSRYRQRTQKKSYVEAILRPRMAVDDSPFKVLDE